jgi:hypothetical protein
MKLLFTGTTREPSIIYQQCEVLQSTVDVILDISPPISI